MRTTTLAATLVILCLVPFELLGGELPDEPLWRTNESGAWCFIRTPNRSCLPPEFELFSFESGTASWRYWKEGGPSYLIKYSNDSPLVGEDALPGDDFLVASVSETLGVVITELSADLSKPGAHKLSAFVIEFDGGFSLTILGPDTAGLRSFTNEIVESWVATENETGN